MSDHDITQRIPTNWTPTITHVASRRIRPETLEIAFTRAVTQPIHFSAAEAHEAWVAELRKTR